MIVINMMGGLGNQMFQYAFLLKYRYLGRTVTLRKGYADDLIEKKQYNEIFDVFGIEREFISEESLRILLGNDKPIKRIIYRSFKLMNRKHVEENRRGKYCERYLKYHDAYLDGYWQSYKYFSDINNTIVNTYYPVIIPNQKCREMIEKIRDDTSSVSVHLRLGDYTSEVNQKIYGNICTLEYYRKAFELIRKKLDNPTFYVFSNDLHMASAFFEHEDVCLVDCNTLSEAWADMLLMSLCKHNIIANSSFSWWGAYLNKNDDKIIIAPSKWKNHESMPDICPGSWLRL